MKTIQHSSIQQNALHPHAQLAHSIVDLISNGRKVKRVVVVTGAGISTSSGIPDFRSMGGLYDVDVSDDTTTTTSPSIGTDSAISLKEGCAEDSVHVQKRASRKKTSQAATTAKGKQMFDASLFSSPDTTRLFFQFMAQLKQATDEAQPTPAHEMIAYLKKRGLLARCYTQNIDCLEQRVGLRLDITEDSSSSSLSGDMKKTVKNSTRKNKRGQDVDVVQLHGTLSHVHCTVCHTHLAFSSSLLPHFQQGTAPPCPSCSDRNAVRQAQSRRQLSVGILRPDIVLYNEQHPRGDIIGEQIMADLSRGVDLLVVMGTSLKVDGIKKVVRTMARQIRAKYASHGDSESSCDNENDVGVECERSIVEPRVILINKTPLTAEWNKVFDVYWEGESDEICRFIQQGMEERRRVQDYKKQQRQRQKERRESTYASVPIAAPSPVPVVVNKVEKLAIVDYIDVSEKSLSIAASASSSKENVTTKTTIASATTSTFKKKQHKKKQLTIEQVSHATVVKKLVAIIPGSSSSIKNSAKGKSKVSPRNDIIETSDADERENKTLTTYQRPESRAALRDGSVSAGITGKNKAQSPLVAPREAPISPKKQRTKKKDRKAGEVSAVVV